MTIKSWFLIKNFNTNERIALNEVEPIIEKETEKAVFLKWNTEYGIIKRWVPKSCIENATTSTKTITSNLTGKTVTTKDGKTLEVVTDNGSFVVLADGKKYAKFTLTY